jgi:anaerobic selenocysteine-containing dehydrogenase
MGLPRIPQPWADAPPKDGHLRLLSPASLWRMNDSYANDKNIQQRAGEANVIMHPEDAHRLGLKDGARVRLENETGWLELIAKVDHLTPQGVALTYKGRWPKQEQQRRNVNVLNPGCKTDMGESSSVHGIEVSIRPC